MSKLLKVIVNTLLLLAILSAGALVIPPFAGITTLVSDGMGKYQQFLAALSRTQRRQIRHRLRREKKSWLMTIPESISIRYSPSTPLPEPHP